MISKVFSSSNPKARFFLIGVFSTSFHHLAPFNPYRLPISSSSQYPARRSLRLRGEAFVMSWPMLELSGYLLFSVAPRSFATSNYRCDQILKHYMQTDKPRRFNVIPNHFSTTAQPNRSLQYFNIISKDFNTLTTPKSQTQDLHLCYLVSNIHPTRSLMLSQSRRLGHLQPISSLVTGGSARACTTSHY